MRCQVLVVDDHAAFRHLAGLLLAASGFEVVGEAADARTALAQVELLRPDAVLLDVMLPDRCGVEVARELIARSDPPRVILTSSRSQSDFGDAFEWPGGCDFVPKHELSGPAVAALLDGGA
jgi:DNA-binding NarL/FixJ family response regulator